MVSDGITFTSQTDIVEKFNDFFTSIANNLDRNLPVNETCPTSYVIPQRSSFLLSPVIENEVFKIVSDLKITKTQLNHLPVKIFKIIFPHIAPKFCKLINLTFSYGEFPKSFKISRISQIYKSGLRSDPSNYRPIASIPYFSKILEKCLCNQLVSYFDSFSLFTNVQYGFRKNNSTCDALLKLTESIYKSFNSKNHQLNVFIDLRKAFDTVSHSVLLSKLEKYGVRGTALNLINSFLCDRKQYVQMGKNSSSLKDINIGVPQGSNLGPILFLIYVNDFPEISSEFESVLFADDTALAISNFNYDFAISN